MKPRTLAKSLAALVAATMFALLLSSPAQAQPDRHAEPTAHGAEAAAAQGLPLCTKSTILRSFKGKIEVPATSNFDPDCLIGDGLVGCSNCPAISVLQRSLSRCHSDNQRRLQLDGEWGPLTKAVLQRVQRSLGVTPDGVYGPATRNKMRHSLDGRCLPYRTRQAGDRCGRREPGRVTHGGGAPSCDLPPPD